jgi:hypothetical protein
MKPTNEDIAELQRVWKEVFDEEITPAFASQRGNELIELYLLMGKLTAQSTDQDPPAPDASALPSSCSLDQ